MALSGNDHMSLSFLTLLAMAYCWPSCLNYLGTGYYIETEYARKTFTKILYMLKF